MGTVRTAVARIAVALVVAAVAITPCAAIEFDELDKPPEGAHKGQMFLGVVISVGAPSGELVDAETAFVDGSTYTFENEVTKQLKVSHLFFGVGASFEYMPIDHVGAKTRAMQTIVVQRTEFGTDYENWRENRDLTETQRRILADRREHHLFLDLRRDLRGAGLSSHHAAELGRDARGAGGLWVGRVRGDPRGQEAHRELYGGK